MPILGIFSKRDKHKNTPSKRISNDSVNDHDSLSVIETIESSLPSSPSSPPVNRGYIPYGSSPASAAAAASSSKLKLPFRRKKSSGFVHVEKEDAQSIVVLPQTTYTPYSPSAVSEPGDRRIRPPHKGALFSAYADPQGALSTRSLPAAKHHTRSNSRDIASSENLYSSHGSPQHLSGLQQQQQQPQQQPPPPPPRQPAPKKGLFAWAQRDRKKSQPPPATSTLSSADKLPPRPSLDMNFAFGSLTADSNTSVSQSSHGDSFNLKAFRHVTSIEPPSPDLPTISPRPPSSLSSPFIAPPPRPRENSVASDSSQRISVAAFREAAARRNQSPGPPSVPRPPSRSELSYRLEPSSSRPNLTAAVHPTADTRVTASSARPSPVRNSALRTSDDDSSSSESEDNESDSEEEPTLRPKRPGEKSSPAIHPRQPGGKKASSELGHYLRAPAKGPSVGAARSALGHGDAEEDSKHRESSRSPALQSNAAMDRPSVMLAPSSVAPGSSRTGPPTRHSRQLSASSALSSSSGSDSDNAPLATLMMPKRPGSAASSATTGSRPRAPAKPLIDISSLSTPALPMPTFGESIFSGSLSGESMDAKFTPPVAPSEREKEKEKKDEDVTAISKEKEKKPTLSDRLARVAQGAKPDAGYGGDVRRASLDVLRDVNTTESPRSGGQIGGSGYGNKAATTPTDSSLPSLPTRSQTAPVGFNPSLGPPVSPSSTSTSVSSATVVFPTTTATNSSHSHSATPPSSESSSPSSLPWSTPTTTSFTSANASQTALHSQTSEANNTPNPSSTLAGFAPPLRRTNLSGNVHAGLGNTSTSSSNSSSNGSNNSPTDRLRPPTIVDLTDPTPIRPTPIRSRSPQASFSVTSRPVSQVSSGSVPFLPPVVVQAPSSTPASAAGEVQRQQRQRRQQSPPPPTLPAPPSSNHHKLSPSQSTITTVQGKPTTQSQQPQRSHEHSRNASASTTRTARDATRTVASRPIFAPDTTTSESESESESDSDSDVPMRAGGRPGTTARIPPTKPVAAAATSVTPPSRSSTATAPSKPVSLPSSTASRSPTLAPPSITTTAASSLSPQPRIKPGQDVLRAPPPRTSSMYALDMDVQTKLLIPASAPVTAPRSSGQHQSPAHSHSHTPSQPSTLVPNGGLDTSKGFTGGGLLASLGPNSGNGNNKDSGPEKMRTRQRSSTVVEPGTGGFRTSSSFQPESSIPSRGSIAAADTLSVVSSSIRPSARPSASQPLLNSSSHHHHPHPHHTPSSSLSGSTLAYSSIIGLPPPRPFATHRGNSPSASSTGGESSSTGGTGVRTPMTPRDGSEIGVNMRTTATRKSAVEGGDMNVGRWEKSLDGERERERDRPRIAGGRPVAPSSALGLGARETKESSAKDREREKRTAHRKSASAGFEERSREFLVGVDKGREPKVSSDDERRRERRRSEARNAIELGNVVNGRINLNGSDDEEDLPLNGMGSRMSMNMLNNPTMFPTGPLPTWSRPPSMLNGGLPPITPNMIPTTSPPQPTAIPIQMQMQMQMQMPMSMNMSMFPVPPPNADPAFLAAHQQAMMMAKQAYQFAVAQQALAQANEDWERGSSVSAFTSGGGGVVPAAAAAMGGMPGMYPSPYGMWPGPATHSMIFPTAAQSMYAGSVIGGGSDVGGPMGGGGGGWGSKSAYGDMGGDRNSMFRGPGGGGSGMKSGSGGKGGGGGTSSSASAMGGPGGRPGPRPRTKTAPSSRAPPPSSWKKP